MNSYQAEANAPRRAGYDYFSDYVTGKEQAVDLETGEVLDTVRTIIPVGSSIITPQAQRYNAKRSKLFKDFLNGKEQAKKLGRFNFISINKAFADLSPAALARLVYFSTYIRYGDNKLYLNKNTPIQAKHLKIVLGISSAQVYRFIDEAEGYIAVDKDGGLMLTGGYFIFGKLTQSEDKAAYQKLYIESVRRLYKATPVSKHSQLGYVFMMLPYINKEHNVLCYNIYERDLDKVDTMSIAEFCRIVGYSEKNASRLRREYSKITFPVENRQEQFCMFVSDGCNLNNAQIYINPHILYNGSNAHLVEILSVFCKKNESKI